MELGYFPEEDAYDNLVFLVETAQLIMANDSAEEAELALVNLKVVMLLLDAISYNSVELLDLKIRTY